ncbi:MAG: hypothetical protein R3270_10340 [Gammaproteobacteria bacterium]|nr:hypothetical protein [Gammaproteobacteria bacterium]
MNRKLSLPTILLFSVLLSGCPVESGEDAQLINGEYVFEVSHSNSAVIYEDSGRFINSKGEIWRYEAPSDYNITLSNTDRTHGIPRSVLKQKYADALMVNLVELPPPLERVALLHEALNGFLEWRPEWAYSSDGGVYTVRTYLYDKQHDSYREIDLVICGDSGFRNTSAAADVLLEWLDERIYVPCRPW